MFSCTSSSSQHNVPNGAVRDIPPFPTPHDDYYFQDGNLVIRVEDKLFKLFRSTFTRHSTVFKDLFSLPTGCNGGPVEGHEDDNPLTLPGISSVDFERLLWVLYPSNYASHKAKSVDEWRSILSLATRWEFADVRTLAIRQLQALDMPPVERILIAHEFDVGGRWALAAYTALCERPEPLSIAEATALGLETTTRVAQLREQIRARAHKSSGMGGYHSLTRVAAMRHGAGGGTPAGKLAPRGPGGERLQWGISKSFLAQGEIGPSPTRAGTRKATAKASPTSIPGTARLVAQAFGIELGH